MQGKLYLCATPIGNLEDITLRVLRVLKEADIIAAEDTRHTIKLLNHYDIKTPMTSYHEHNKMEKTAILVNRMIEGHIVAQVSDAGTPGISDPGEELAIAAYEAGIEVTSLPGATALVMAVVLSRLSARRFSFEGFLPSNKKEQLYVLDELIKSTKLTVFYEAPHRLKKTLQNFMSVVGGERRISICRELTKKHETILQMTLEEAVAYYEVKAPRGEYVLVLDGRKREELTQESQLEWQKISLEQHMKIYLDQGLSKNNAMKMVARDRGVSKRDIYKEFF